MVETGWCTSLDRHRHKETGYVIGGGKTRAIIIQDGSQPRALRRRVLAVCWILVLLLVLLVLQLI